MKNKKTISKTTQVNKSESFDLVQWFCIIDDFFKLIKPEEVRVGRKPTLTISELATIILIGARYECGCLKSLYSLIKERFSIDFTIPNYQNFVCLMNKYSIHCMNMIQYLVSIFKNQKGVITFCDSTKLEVCKIYREYAHKVMRLVATKSKSTTGWFYGMRLHILCDRDGKLMGIRITTASTGERCILERFMDSISECIIVADAGYVSNTLNKKAAINKNILLTAVRKNMRTVATNFQNKCMNMRSRIETVFGVMKGRYNLVSSLPRSINGYLAHYIRSIFAYRLLG
jgi:hypothetical protein